MNYPYSSRPEVPENGWTGTTRLIVGIVVLVLVGLAVSAFRAVFVPLIIATIFAYLLHPAVEFVSARTRVPYKLATALIYLILLAGFILLIAALTPVVAVQVRNLRIELERIIGDLLELSNQYESVPVLGIEVEVQTIVDEVAVTLQEAVRSVASDVVGIAFGLAETMLLVIFVFLLAFYLTRDTYEIRVWLRALVPPGYKEDSDRLFAELDGVWSAFFRGQLTLALVVAAIQTVIASIIGLPQPIFWGIFAGLLEFLPSVGHAIYFIFGALVAIIEGSTTLPVSNVAFVVVFAIVHTVFTQVDLNLLIPRIIGAQVHLHPMVVIIGIIIGASVGGVLGVALAAPVIASARVLGRYIYARLFNLDPFPQVEKEPADIPEPQRATAAEETTA